MTSRGWYQAIGITAGVVGIVMLSALIAFITTALDRRSTTCGRASRVVEEAHTLILGWDEQRVVEIVRELVIANESRKRRAVVILADQDKEYMDDDLSVSIPDERPPWWSPGREPVVAPEPGTRLGGHRQLGDSAQRMLRLRPRAMREESDARVVKTLLAVQHQRPPDRPLHIVTEIFDPAIRALIDQTAGREWWRCTPGTSSRASWCRPPAPRAVGGLQRTALLPRQRDLLLQRRLGQRHLRRGTIPLRALGPHRHPHQERELLLNRRRIGPSPRPTGCWWSPRTTP